MTLIRVAPSDDSSGEQLEAEGLNSLRGAEEPLGVASICVALNFNCFVLPPLVLRLPQVRLHFGLKGLESLAYGNGGWIILPLDVRLVLGMEGVFDLLVVFVEPVYMASGLGAKDLSCSLGDRVFKGRPFRRAAVGSH